jgi:acetyltransferase-like isoleucine patch superfamily enzyme
MALLDRLILAPEGINTMSNITQEMPESSQTKNKKVAFVKSTIAEFSDVPMWMVNALDIYKATNGQCVIDGNNKIIITGSKDATALRNTNIFLSGKNNEIVLHNLKNVTKLDVACVEGGKVHLGGPEKINKAVIMASHGSSVSVGNDCLISRDVIIYSSAAHAVYNLDGTHRGLKNITIGNKVWLGQGVRVLAGASVGDNSVIGSYSVLAGKISNNCAAAGNPCRVTTKDIFWTTSGSGSNLNYYEQASNRDKPSPSFIKKTKD